MEDGKKNSLHQQVLVNAKKIYHSEENVYLYLLLHSGNQHNSLKLS